MLLGCLGSSDADGRRKDLCLDLRVQFNWTFNQLNPYQYSTYTIIYIHIITYTYYTCIVLNGFTICFTVIRTLSIPVFLQILLSIHYQQVVAPITAALLSTRFQHAWARLFGEFKDVQFKSKCVSVVVIVHCSYMFILIDACNDIAMCS